MSRFATVGSAKPRTDPNLCSAKDSDLILQYKFICNHQLGIGIHVKEST